MASVALAAGIPAAALRPIDTPRFPWSASPKNVIVATSAPMHASSHSLRLAPRAPPGLAGFRRTHRNNVGMRKPTMAVASSSAAATALSNLFPYVGWICVVYSWGMLAWYHWKLYHSLLVALALRLSLKTTNAADSDATTVALPGRKEDAVTGTLSGPNMEARRKWVAAYAKNKKDVITAVQSLRNGLLIATANSSITIALISVCLGPLLDAYIRGAFPIVGELLLFPFPVLLNVLKFSILFGLLVTQFICFTQCCYYWVHMTFMLPVVCSSDNECVVTEEGLVDIALHAQFFWWWGYRCLYMLIPAVVWVVVGTLPFAVVSSVMVVALNYLDRPLRKAKPLEYYL